MAANTRDSNRFDVTVNVEPQKKAAFYLNYEELLQREREQYEIVINIHPGQVVRDLQVEVGTSTVFRPEPHILLLGEHK